MPDESQPSSEEGPSACDDTEAASPAERLILQAHDTTRRVLASLATADAQLAEVCRLFPVVAVAERAEPGPNRELMAGLEPARLARANLVRAAQQTSEALMSVTRYLQAREQFLQSRAQSGDRSPG